MKKTEGIQSALLPTDYDLVTMFEKPEFAKLSVVSSAKELQKHIEVTYPDSDEYAALIPRLQSILQTDTFI